MSSLFDPNIQQNSLTAKITAGLERISEAYKVLLWDFAKKEGLSPIQVQLLIFIAYHPTELNGVSALAKEFNLTKATISDAVKTLLSKGLVQKTASTEDNRSYSLSLTSMGQQIVKAAESFADPIKNILNTIDGAKTESFYKTLSDLIYNLNQTGILSVQRTCKACRFYQVQDGGHYCNYLNTRLADKDIRLDCPEFEKSPV